MRRKGWAGRPPADDAEARERIIEATMLCVDRFGAAKTSLSDVAARLGITRQTVYRYFPSTEQLFLAVGLAAADTFADEVAQHVRGVDDPAEKVVEMVAYSLEQLPAQRYLVLLVSIGRSDAFSQGVTSPVGIAISRRQLLGTGVDWAALGYDDREIDDLAELTLRFIQSLTIDPGSPPRTGAALRAYLRRWLGPAVAPARPATAAAVRTRRRA